MRNNKIESASKRNTRRGLLTFEWVLIFALLAVSYGSVAGAALGLDASYVVNGLADTHVDSANAAVPALSFQAPGMFYQDYNGTITGNVNATATNGKVSGGTATLSAKATAARSKVTAAEGSLPNNAVTYP